MILILGNNGVIPLCWFSVSSMGLRLVDMLGDHQYIYLTYLGTGPPVLRADVFPVLVDSPDPVNGPASRPRSAGVLVLFAPHWVPVFLE